MSTSRYTFVKRINNEKIATTDISSRIYFGVLSGKIKFSTSRLSEGRRLDHVAAQSYGDASLWWIIASASGIGWNLQCPPDTVINVPEDLNQVYTILRQ